MRARIHGASIGGWDGDGNKDDTYPPEVWVAVPAEFVVGHSLGELTSPDGHRRLAAMLLAEAEAAS
ncbi:hypothetical protein CH259_16705 [Rhodococcus sp. 05-2254-4]|nr:hypothetical protein CH259_16705 [Rhodococcus sp. 05-2254-4]OZE48093.1 hypothetical protein CH261_09300 [Rhodococcus sp. 05-2254-3]OZE49304.1 hypothetical protein CH283_17085 [Rhodococcus sp. 05-2254-2]